jgi:hypothetical protein
MKNEPAFPNEGFNGWGEPFQGMTLRDYFAAKASEEDIKNFSCSEGEEITGTDTLGRNWKRHEVIYYTREQARYRHADAMLKAREA